MHVGHVFDHVRKKRWKFHADEKCPHCKGPRFITQKSVNGKTIYQPFKWYIDFGLKEQWLSIVNSPEFRAQRGNNRNTEPGSFFASQEAERLRQFTVEHNMTSDEPEAGLHRDFSPFEIALDWLEPWNSVAYSNGMAIVRNLDAADRNLGKNSNWRPLIITPGKSAPKNCSPYFIQSCQEALDLAMNGVQVTERYPAAPLNPTPVTVGATISPEQSPDAAQPNPDPTIPAPDPGPATASDRGPRLPQPVVPYNKEAEHVVRSFLHRAFLIGVLADTPARYV